MCKSLLRITLFIAFLAVSATSLAVPYASFIRVSSTNPAEGVGLDISYVLNDAADSVTIDILDSGSGVVATFAGTATRGDNSVSWDGTVDNAGGTAVAAGDNYAVRITADKNISDWTEYIERASGSGGSGQVFSGFSPNDTAVPTDTSSDVFGTVLVSTSWNGVNGIIQFRTDLLTLDGVDGTVDFLDCGITTSVNYAVWNLDVMPNGRDVYANGEEGVAEGGKEHWIVDGSGGSFTEMTEADPNDDVSSYSSGPWFWGCCIVQEGTKTVGYGAHNTLAFDRKIRKWEIQNGLAVPGSATDFLSIDSSSVMSGVETDPDGNLYFTVESGGDGSRVYRFDAVDVQPISASAGIVLTTADASWVVDFPAPWDEVLSANVSPDGNVYALVNDDVADAAAIFLVGPASTASLVKTLTAPTDIVADGFTVDGKYTCLTFDLFGNLYVHDRGIEYFWAWSPPGNFSSPVDAPASQEFDIVTVTGLPEWSDYR